MRDLLQQDRALSPSTIRLGVGTLGALFLVAAIIIVLLGGYTIIAYGDIFVGLLQLCGGLGLLLAIFLMVRLQAELVMASHRTNDRLMIMTDALSPRVSETAAAKPARKKSTPRKVKPRSATTAPTPPANDSTSD